MKGRARNNLFCQVPAYMAMCLLMVFGFACWHGIAEAAPFEGGTNSLGAASAIGEVACHGEDELEDQFMTGIGDAYTDAFNGSEKFSLHSPSPNPELMVTVHRDAIVHGHYYNRGRSNAELIRYANDVFGKNYRPTDEEYKAMRKKAGTPYKLSPQVAYDLKQYAAEEGIRYFLFCNISHIEVWLKNILFSDNKFASGKSMAVELEYYLVDANTGYVYDGFSREAKTANMINAIIVSGGKNMPSNVLFQRIMEEQVKDVVKKMGNDGLKKLQKIAGEI